MYFQYKKENHTSEIKHRDHKQVLIVTAVEKEREAVMRGINGNSSFDCIAGGVGQVAAAISTINALSKKNYDLVISAGIGGGFSNQAEVGSVVVASEIIAADLGAESIDSFSSVDELGFGSSRIAVDTSLVDRLTEAINAHNLSATKGPILTLSTVTGTKETALKLASRIPGAAVEAMEGFGVASAAQNKGIPALEIRTISNPVGPRDRSAWKIKEALEALQQVSKVLLEVL